MIIFSYLNGKVFLAMIDYLVEVGNLELVGIRVKSGHKAGGCMLRVRLVISPREHQDLWGYLPRSGLSSSTSTPEILMLSQMARTAILLKTVPKGRTGDLPRPVCDDDVGQVQEWLQRHELQRLGKDTTHQAVDLRAAENAFHPVQDELKSLRWDRKPRLDLWLQTYWLL